MVLPIDYESYSYRFYNNLNEDVHLKSDEMGRWDIDFDYEQEDWVMDKGFDSLANACVIAIMTRFHELDFMDLYSDFGCRLHELIKTNKTKSVMYRIELFTTEVLENMRRVRKVNWVEVSDNPSNSSNGDYNYQVHFNVSCTLDEDFTEKDVNTTIVEEDFLI